MMGLSLIFSGSKDLSNPNPHRFSIHKTEEVGSYLVTKIYYPDCTNYEGFKILVYKDKTIGELRFQSIIDPHFTSDNDSLVARFIPTQEGWEMAMRFAHSQLKESV